MSNWLPIETAPKDGTRIQIANKHCVDNAYWSDCAEHGHFVNGPGWQVFSCEDHWYSTVFDAPTHWMPLPEPPEGIST